MLLQFFRSTSTAAEECFYAEVSEPLTAVEEFRLRWFLHEPSNVSSLQDQKTVLEVGPRLHVETAYSSTGKTILSTVGISKVVRLESSRRFGFGTVLDEDEANAFLAPLHDRMTEVRYREPLTKFEAPPPPEPLRYIDLGGEDWRETLNSFSNEFGLGWDEQDFDYVGRIYREVEKRKATDTELFGAIGQANSDHSRHWRFRGIWIIDGVKKPATLMQMIKRPLSVSNQNCIIAFHDNSSAIRGSRIPVLIASDPRRPSLYVYVNRLIHPTITAESHNHPSMIDPYQGMATLIAIIRDQEKVGRGGRIGVLGIGMCVGNFHIPGYVLPWEEDGWKTHPSIATSLQIALRGSQGAFDFANAFGQPAIYGFFRTFGQVLPSGEYRSWYKPVTYGVAAGSIDDAHVQKHQVEPGMVMLLAGGPSRRVGVGGGSGSSNLGGESSAKLDFASVQRGDPEMQCVLDHFQRGCIELLDDNPEESGQDLGAGGIINAGLETAFPAGVRIEEEKIPSADPSLSSRELHSNESQERNISVVRRENLASVHAIARREHCPIAEIGEITGDGRYVVVNKTNGTTPVDLPLNDVLGDLPPKTFYDKRIVPKLQPLVLPSDFTIAQGLDRVLRLPAVASKQWLTRRVDRSVTGLVAQQQCVGPNHLPVSDFAVKADSYLVKSGTAYSLGEQPNVGLLSPGAMVRLAVTEALLNMAGAVITDVADIKGATNWMLAAKVPGQGAWLYEAMEQLVEFMEKLRVASHGGKDSMSLAGMGESPDGESQLVVSPAQFIYAPHAVMPDVTRKVTPYIRHSDTYLVLIDLGMGKNRLGGSALAQVYRQLGNEAPDMEDADLLVRTFKAIQKLVEEGLITSSHDRSDGGLATTVLEMGFASNLGIELWCDSDVIPALFSQEPGYMLGCAPNKIAKVRNVLSDYGVPATNIGFATKDLTFRVYEGTREIYKEDIMSLRSTWEETSYQLDRHLRNPVTSDAEKLNTVYLASPPAYRLTFTPPTFPYVQTRKPPKMIVLREEGSNGEREMAAYFIAAGFDALEVPMRDLLARDFSLDSFRGIAMVGGFSFRDVFGAGRGWAGTILFNQWISEEFQRFRERDDTFGLGICNGCQVMGELGWVPGRFVQNKSRIFESRFVNLEILKNDAMFFRGMAGSQLGVWLAHGEGQLETDQLETIQAEGLAPLRYLDPKAETTEQYPFNPNGSPEGIAGLLSSDQRFLAMMPHIERTSQMWNWPWAPEGWEKFQSSPWFKVFTNIREWCEETNKIGGRRKVDLP